MGKVENNIKKSIYKALMFLLIFSPFLFSTPPLTVFYQYEINGNILDIKNPKNTTLVLFGKTQNSSNWYPLYQFLNNDTEFKDAPICILDSTATFTLKATTQFGKLDSLKIGQLDQNKLYNYSNSIYVGNLTGKEIKSRFEYSNQSGCSCENTSSSELVVIGYFIQLNNQNIKIN